MRSRYAIVAIVVLIGGLIYVERTTRFSPGPDARVLAFTTEPVRVHLDFSPSRDEIAERLVKALRTAADDEHGLLAEELRSLAGDDRFVADLSETAARRLDTDAAALAFSTTRTDGQGDTVTIVAVTIEILPRGNSDGISRAHEDGHATINNGIVERCGDEIVAFEVASGKTGNSLVAAINDHIALLEDQAHSQYHVDVSDGVFGSHPRAAERALQTIERAGCVAYAA